MDLVVHEAADRITIRDAAVVLLRTAFLLGERGGAHPQAPQPSLGSVQLGARRSHRHPHGRVRLLERLGDDVAGRHLETGALPAEVIVGPHLRDHPTELVPRLLRVVGIGAEPAEFGPRARSGRAQLQAAVRDGVERCRPLGNPDRVVHLGHAHHGTVAHSDALRLRRDGREEHLGRGAVRVLLEEVMLHRPDVVEPQLVGHPALFERIVVCQPFVGPAERPRHRQLVEDPELHHAVLAQRLQRRPSRKMVRVGAVRLRTLARCLVERHVVDLDRHDPQRVVGPLDAATRCRTRPGRPAPHIAG